MSAAEVALLAIIALFVMASVALLAKLDEVENEKRTLAVAEHWRECMARVIELETMLREKEDE